MNNQRLPLTVSEAAHAAWVTAIVRGRLEQQRKLERLQRELRLLRGASPSGGCWAWA